MSKYEEYRSSRISWGINVLGSFCVEIEAKRRHNWVRHWIRRSTRLLDRLPASRTFPDWRRPKKHEPPLGPNVPLDNVLWTEGTPHCGHIGH